MFKLLVDAQPDVVKGKAVHFAAEPALAPIFKEAASEYMTASYFYDADLKLDITAMDLPNGSVDTFIASHILEHVDDRKALAEMYRCLRPGGHALLAFPIIEAWKTTYENSSAVGKNERELHFGQWDHVRYYGADVRDRIQEPGFTLSEFTASPEQCVRYGLIRGETIFIAKKPE